MKSSYRFLIVLTLLMLSAFPVLAQTAGTTSTLLGTVTSEGSAIPGVLVTASSPSLQGTRTSITGESGGYTIAALPPGQYTVQFSLEGMQTVTKRVTLSLAQQSRVDAELKVGSVAESITVTAAAPAVLESTQLGANFNQSDVDKLPVARNVRQTVLLAPGVNPNGVNNQITIQGAPSYENIFMVNGVVVNENLRGQPHNLFIEDAIQETTVLTGGISAEYGRFTGGVVSTVTRSGGNDFTGSFRDSLTNPDWTETPDLAGATAPPDVTNQVYEATLGGRIIRDRLWFFGAGRQAKTSQARATFRTGLGYVNGFDEKRYEGKLTGQVTARHNLMASYLDVTNTESNNSLAPIYDFASIVPTRQLPNSIATATYNGIFTNNLLAEVAWSQKEYQFINSGGTFTDRIRGTWIEDSVTAGRMNAPVFCGVCGPEARNSDSIGAKATYFLSTRAIGNHNIVAGADRFSETRESNNYQSASQYQISARVARVPGTNDVVPVFGSGTQLSWRPIFVLSPGTDLSSDAFFVNDRWDLNSRLSFNLGVRYDVNDAVDADGTVVSDDSNFSPRLGVMWDVRGDGRHRVAANYGRYVAKITDGSNVTSTAQAAGQPALFTWNYTGPAVNAIDAQGNLVGNPTSSAEALAILFNWFDSIGGTANTGFVSSTYPGYSSRFPESLASPSVDEFTLSYGMQLGANAYVKVDGTHREWGNFYAAQLNSPTQRLTPPNGIANDVTYTVNDDEYTERTYNGISLQGQWRRARLNLGGNYTWSTLKGNDVAEGAGTATIRNTPGEIYYPEYLNYAQRRPMGYLGQDRRHRARFWAGYDFDTPIGNFNVSALESYDSGFAYSAIGSIDATGRNANFRYAGVATNPGYTLSAAGQLHDYYFSERGAYRTNARLATDLALNYSLPIWGRVTFFARGDVLNVFNTQEVVDPSLINTSVTTSRTGGATVLNADGTIRTLNSGLRPFNPFTETPKECPQGASAQQCYDMGAHYQLSSAFGTPSSQDALQVADRSLAPRTYRVTLGFRF
ncbi:MAG TPA: TonB-dependent receptor [Thermoanaerobaculia bacterium]|jgi:hypothetical protein